MADNRESTGKLGLFLGSLVAIATALILMSGGEHLGKKSVRGDDDLPPVATARPSAAPLEQPGEFAPPAPTRPIVMPPSPR